jgi:hypothetical protein
VSRTAILGAVPGRDPGHGRPAGQRAHRSRCPEGSGLLEPPGQLISGAGHLYCGGGETLPVSLDRTVSLGDAIRIPLAECPFRNVPSLVDHLERALSAVHARPSAARCSGFGIHRGELGPRAAASGSWTGRC